MLMLTSSASVVLAKPADEVFAYVADLRNEPKWHVDIASVPPDTDPVPVVGKRYPVKFKPFMGKTDGSFTALEVVPGSKVVHQAELVGIRPRITYTVEAVDEGTRFTRGVELSLSGPLVLMRPLMGLMVPRRNKVFLANLAKELG
jgi:uncharacterized protein YndB with AHSA1/START domain